MNSVGRDDVSDVLQLEISETTVPCIDNIPICGKIYGLRRCCSSGKIGGHLVVCGWTQGQNQSGQISWREDIYDESGKALR